MRRWMHCSKLVSLFLAILFPIVTSAISFNFTGFEDGFTAITGTAALTTSNVRTGAYALRASPTTTATGFNQILQFAGTGNSANFNETDLYIRFYFRIEDAPDADDEEFFTCEAAAGTVKLAGRLTSARVIALYDSAGSVMGTGTTVLALNTYYRIEVRCGTGAGTGTYDLLVNGVSEPNLSGAAGQLGANNNQRVRLGKVNDRNGETIDFYYDDVSIKYDAYPGAGQIKALLPTANGSTAEWIDGSGGTADEWQQVNQQVSDDDTTYISNSISASQSHLVTLQSLAAAAISASSINGVRFLINVREDISVTSSNHMRIRSGDTTTDTTARNLSTAYAATAQVHLVDPNTAAPWTEAGVNALQMGSLEDNAISVMRATQILAQVDYIPRSGNVARPLMLTGGGS